MADFMISATIDVTNINETKNKLIELNELADALLSKFEKLGNTNLSHELKISLRADDLIAAMRLQDYRSAHTDK